MFSNSDHILTRLDLTNNPASLANVYTNFGALPTPIFIERPFHQSMRSRTDGLTLDPNGDQLNNLGGSLNGSRLALAMEMARLDVERMKFIEAPITITKTHQNTAFSEKGTENTDNARSGDEKNRNKKNTSSNKSKPVTNAVRTETTDPKRGPSYLSLQKALAEIVRARGDTLECIRSMAARGAHKFTAQYEPGEEKRLDTRVNQQTVRCARNLYSLQQQIRQLQNEVDRGNYGGVLNSNGEINVEVEVRGSAGGNKSRANEIVSILNKLLSVHRGVAKVSKDVVTVSRESYGIEKQFSRTYSELAHLIRQMTLICDQIGVEPLDCHVEVLDGLSVGEIVPENNASGYHKKKIEPARTVEFLQHTKAANVRGASPTLSPDREETLRAGIIALGIDKILDAQQNKRNNNQGFVKQPGSSKGSNLGKTTVVNSNAARGKPITSNQQKKNVIYTTTRSRVPVKLTRNVKSNILQSTVASQLKSVHADMIVRNPISDLKTPSSGGGASALSNHSRLKSSSPISPQCNESLNRLCDRMDESAIFSNSRQQSPSPKRNNNARPGSSKRDTSPRSSAFEVDERGDVGFKDVVQDRICLLEHEQAAAELRSYAKNTKKLVNEMKQEREMTMRLFDRNKGLSVDAYNDIKEICKIKLKTFASQDLNAKAVYIELLEMSDAKFRYLVKECSMGFKSFDYEDIADSILDYLVDQLLENKELKKLKRSKISNTKSKKCKPSSKVSSQEVAALKEMVSKIEKIEALENEIAERSKSDFLSAYATTNDLSGMQTDSINRPPKYVHFREYPYIVDILSPKSTIGDLIIVNKGQEQSTSENGNLGNNDSEIGLDNELIRSEVGVDNDLYEHAENDRKAKQMAMSRALNVDMKKVNPGQVLDDMTKSILADCLDEVLEEFSSVCDGFAQAIFVNEFKPSSES